MNRREFLMVSGLLTCAPGRIWAELKADAHTVSANGELRLLKVLCQLVIPETDTPGAHQVGVPAFVDRALRHHLNSSTPGILAALEAELDAAAGGDFLQLDPAERYRLLEAVDARAYGQGALETGRAELPPSSWPILKGLILMGYYTSEAGASEELIYRFVPGRYDGDIPFEPGSRGYSTDWWGNLF